MEVDILIHAAALKQVETSEYNPFETVKTNILGAQNLIELAIQKKIKKIKEYVKKNLMTNKI